MIIKIVYRLEKKGKVGFKNYGINTQTMQNSIINALLHCLLISDFE
ncbi:MAG: hypothetical protein HPY66_1804 [Firmicutes bacterium]|nr:hypothetical protein [Bacillota bacterium]